MGPDYLIRERDVTEEHLAHVRERRIPPYRHLRKYRLCIQLVLALFGLHLLTTGSGAGDHEVTFPILHQASPALHLVRLGGYAVFSARTTKTHRFPLGSGAVR